MPDLILARLVAECRRAQDALETYSNGEEVKGDLVPLRDAEAEFGRSNITLRRWVLDEGLGERGPYGRLFLNRSLVKQHKVVT